MGANTARDDAQLYSVLKWAWLINQWIQLFCLSGDTRLYGDHGLLAINLLKGKNKWNKHS